MSNHLENIVRKGHRFMRYGFAALGLAALIACNNPAGNNPDDDSNSGNETIIPGFELRFGSLDGSSDPNFSVYAGDELSIFSNIPDSNVKVMQIYDTMNSRWVDAKDGNRFQFSDGDWSDIKKDASGRLYIDITTDYVDTARHSFEVRVRLKYDASTFSNTDTMEIGKKSRNSKIFFDGVLQNTLRDDFQHSMDPGKGKLADVVAEGNYDRIIWKLSGYGDVEKTMKTGESLFEPYILTLEWTGYKDLVAELYYNGRIVGRAGAYISSNNDAPTLPDRAGGNHVYATPGTPISFDVTATDPNEDSLEFILYNDPMQPLSGASISTTGKYGATFSCDGLPEGEYTIRIMSRDSFGAESAGYGEFPVTVK